MQTYRSQRVVTPTGTHSADVTVKDGRIVAIEDWGASNESVIDFAEAVLAPGLIDVHCHINQPGRTDWEGFETATRAAAAGGITLVCDMPLNSEPVTTSGRAFEAKVAASHELLHVDVALYGGVIPGNARDRQALNELTRAGAAAFKSFLCDSGLPSFPPVSRADLEIAMPELRRLGKRLLAHAELFDPAPDPARDAEAAPLSYADTLLTRSERTELNAINLLGELCEQTGCAVHIVHLSSAKALPTLAAWKEAGLPITVETCPHYLTFCAEELDLDPRFKCTPPIRNRANREGLWRGLADGVIDFIATDHSPCPPNLKLTEADTASARWQEAWGGISSLQLLLPAVASEALQRGHSLEQINRWLAERPARWLGLDDRGAIAVGNRADFVAWWPERSFTVRGEQLEHRHPLTPYEGQVLQGVVEATIHGGTLVYRRDQFLTNKARGRVLRLRYGNVGDCAHDRQQPNQWMSRTTPADLEAALRTCCGSETWVSLMMRHHPFATPQQIMRSSETAFDRLDQKDWLEAFSAHPRIGDLQSLQSKYADTASLASKEQRGTATADVATLQALARGNVEYEERFGHVFLICASGRSAAEMLAELERRSANEPAQEFSIACEEQRKITYLRLQQLIDRQPETNTDTAEPSPS